FSYRHRHTRVLPFFPTRRSSDLASTQEVSESEVPVHVPLRRPRPLRFERLRVSVESIQPRPPRPCEVGRPKGPRAAKRYVNGNLDRKSTRLHYSHGSISYAVVGL